MNNILKIAAIAALAFVANNGQAAELVKAQPQNTVELVAVAKMNLAQSIKLNTVTVNTIEKMARTQLAMVDTKTDKRDDASVKTTSLAE